MAIGKILSYRTLKGTLMRYKVVAIADGDRFYGLKYNPVKGTQIVRKLLKSGKLTGKMRMWAQ